MGNKHMLYWAVFFLLFPKVNVLDGEQDILYKLTYILGDQYYRAHFLDKVLIPQTIRL